jgi:hypothetical protein
MAREVMVGFLIADGTFDRYAMTGGSGSRAALGHVAQFEW